MFTDTITDAARELHLFASNDADAELIALARDHARDDAEYAYYQRINA